MKRRQIIQTLGAGSALGALGMFSGCAVFPVEYAAEGFRTDYQSVLGRTCTDHAFGNGEGIQKSRAYCRNIERHAAVATKRMLN